MKKTLLVAALALLLGGCQKEESGATGGVVRVTTISAAIDAECALGTRVSLDYLYDNDTDSESDVVTWKEGDKLRFFELAPVANIRDNLPGFQVGNTAYIDFVLTGGAGTKNGSFSITDQAKPLNTTKTYAVMHAGDISLIGNYKGGSPSLNTIKCSNHIPTNNFTFNDASLGENNKVWAENNLIFWAILQFDEESNQLPLSFNAFTSMFEITIEAKAGVPEFELSSLAFTVIGGATPAENTLISTEQDIAFFSDFTLASKRAPSISSTTMNFPTGIKVSKDAPFKFKVPSAFRFIGYHKSFSDRDIDLTVTSSTGKTYKITKNKAYNNGATGLFPGGSTCILTVTVDADLN